MSNNTKNNNVIVYSIKVCGANPNGDPDNMNLPRQDSDGYGVITQFSIKHHIRNQFVNMGLPVFQSEPNPDDPTTSSLMSKVITTAEENNINVKTKSDPETVKSLTNALLAKYLDIGLFGGTNATIKPSDEFGQLSNIKGAVTFIDAKSIEPISVEGMTITHCITLKDKDKIEKGSSDLMWSYSYVNNATYVGMIVINPNRIEKNCVTNESIEHLINAIKNMYTNDESVARPAGSIKVCNVYSIDVPHTSGIDLFDINVKYRELVRNNIDPYRLKDTFPTVEITKLK